MEPVPPSRTPTWLDRLELITGGGRIPPGQLVAAGAGLVAVVLVGWLLLRTPVPPPEERMPRASPALTSTTVAPTIVAHAAGAVARPGLYTLPTGSRVGDLLAMAGGPTPDADVDRVNLAAKLVDGSQIYVPQVGEVPPAGVGGASGDAAAGPLDLNTATLEQLDRLPGIGPATAEAIVETRARLGGFRTVDDLLEVRGIGPAKLDAIRDLVTV